jgi:hypothetical protein
MLKLNNVILVEIAQTMCLGGICRYESVCKGFK